MFFEGCTQETQFFRKVNRWGHERAGAERGAIVDWVATVADRRGQKEIALAAGEIAEEALGGTSTTDSTDDTDEEKGKSV